MQEPSLLPDGLNINPEPITVEKTLNQGKLVVSNKHMKILEERAQHLPPHASNSKLLTSFIANEVHVVDKSYMSRSFFSKEWQNTISTVSGQFKTRLCFSYCSQPCL